MIQCRNKARTKIIEKSEANTDYKTIEREYILRFDVIEKLLKIERIKRRGDERAATR